MATSQLSALLVVAIVLTGGHTTSTVVPDAGLAAPARTTPVDRAYDTAPHTTGVAPVPAVHGVVRPPAPARQVPVAEDRLNAGPARATTGDRAAPAAIPVGGIRS